MTLRIGCPENVEVEDFIHFKTFFEFNWFQAILRNDSLRIIKKFKDFKKVILNWKIPNNPMGYVIRLFSELRKYKNVT